MPGLQVKFGALAVVAFALGCLAAAEGGAWFALACGVVCGLLGKKEFEG